MVIIFVSFQIHLGGDDQQSYRWPMIFEDKPIKTLARQIL